jgi:hypothetical protein
MQQNKENTMIQQIIETLAGGCIPSRIAPAFFAKQFGVSIKETETALRHVDKLWLTAEVNGNLILSKYGKTLSVLSEDARRVFYCRQAVRFNYGVRVLGIKRGGLKAYNTDTFLADYCKNVEDLKTSPFCASHEYLIEQLLQEAKIKFKKPIVPHYVASQVFDYISFELLARYGVIVEFIELKAKFTGRGLTWYKSKNDGSLII